MTPCPSLLGLIYESLRQELLLNEQLDCQLSGLTTLSARLRVTIGLRDSRVRPVISLTPNFFRNTTGSRASNIGVLADIGFGLVGDG
jgi:hypothetical protein